MKAPLASSGYRRRRRATVAMVATKLHEPSGCPAGGGSLPCIGQAVPFSSRINRPKQFYQEQQLQLGQRCHCADFVITLVCCLQGFDRKAGDRKEQSVGGLGGVRPRGEHGECKYKNKRSHHAGPFSSGEKFWLN